MIDMATIDDALAKAFKQLGIAKADYVIAFYAPEQETLAISTNVDTPEGPRELLQSALRIVSSKNMDTIGEVEGTA